MKVSLFFDRFRYVLAGILHGPSGLKQITETGSVLYLGHNRIIGWEDGLPVRSLMMPPDYSKAFNAGAARLLHGQRFARYYPVAAELCVTGTCDCSCPHCGASVEQGKDLSTEEWIRVVKESMDLGALIISITGGEPLLREDLPQIIRAIERERTNCVMFTNGGLLKERAEELYRAGLRRVFLSLDYDNEETHDRYRGRQGLFRQAIAGILEAKRLGMLTGLSTIATPERMCEGAVERVLELGVRLKVNEIAVFGAMPCGKLESCSSVKNPSREYLDSLRDLMQGWQKKESGPGIWWYDHVRSYQGCGCAAGIAVFSVSNSGVFRPCEFLNLPIGSVRDTDLFTLWTKLNTLALERRKDSPLCWLARQQSVDRESVASPVAEHPDRPESVTTQGPVHARQ
jgi:MoaA/NifB/PqqE/SkfB family radical SAM enzyme